MLIEGGLLSPMVNDTALIETPLQVKMAREILTQVSQESQKNSANLAISRSDVL
jgi:hypothetical protein